MPLPDNPTIKIAFTGLLAICVDADKKNCHVGILRGITDHKLRLKVFKVTPDSTQVLKLDGDPDKEDTFLRLKEEQTDGIRTYKNGPFTRDDTDDPNDFRWVVDIEGPEFHNRALEVPKGVLTPAFHFDNGLLYTGSTSAVDIIQDKKPKMPNTLVAVFIGANIYLADKNEASLRIGTNNPLVMKKEKDVSYKIQVLNNCDKVVKNPGGDFVQFYKAFKNKGLKEIPGPEKFSILAAEVLNAAVDLDSRQHPCGPAFGGKIQAFP